MFYFKNKVRKGDCRSVENKTTKYNKKVYDSWRTWHKMEMFWWIIYQWNMFHTTALRLIVLTQTLRCTVERVFTILENMNKRLKYNLQQEMLESSMLLQCNGNIGEFNKGF